MIKLIKPYITFDEVKQEFQDVFDSGWFTKGKNVEKFRSVIKEYTLAEYAFLTTSATTALSMSLRLLGIGSGDEVIISDFSFPATANVVEDLGAIPVFADVALDTFNMMPDELERKINDKTKAVIFVDALGNPTGIHEIKEICEKYNVKLIEDGACALGSSEYGIKCGSIADLTCYSFHPRKLITTGEGGAITTNHQEYAEELEIKLNHGSVFRNGKFDFVDYGYNYRMSELQAVMGIVQVMKLDDIVESRNQIRDQYIDVMTDLGFTEQKVGDDVRYNVQSLVFKVPENINRDDLVRDLRDNSIETTLGTYCLSGTAYFRNKYDSIQPNSIFLEKNTITFPCYDGIDIERIFNVVRGLV